jgi:hypothetical protein
MKIDLSALIRPFTRKRDGFASPWVSLTVVYAIAPQGLEPDEAFAMRGMVIKARPIDYKYTPPGSFIAFFAGSEAGRHAADALVAALRQYAAEHKLAAFGACAETGQCLATRRAGGGFSAPPAGEVIASVRAAATAAANVNAEASK